MIRRNTIVARLRYLNSKFVKFGFCKAFKIPGYILCVTGFMFIFLAIIGCHRPREISLFDEDKFGRWAITDFGGHGDVYVKNGNIYLEMGNYLTGINWTGPVVRMNYEVYLEAMRVNGSDFFCGLTFPVGDRLCTIVLGGWGGSVCGLSNIDYYDAANNETTRIISFENGRWYKVRLRVTADKIEGWLDDEKIVDVVTTGRHIDIRPEVDMSQPLGIATWQTTGAIRNIRLKKLNSKAIKERD